LDLKLWSKGFDSQRQLMVAQQIHSRGIEDPRVLEAMRKVPRERFIPTGSRNRSYEDGPVPIGCGQTISQPYIVAYMTELLILDGSERVLEIGTGSGYQTALLAETATRVYTIEFIPELGEQARQLLVEEMGYGNISFKIGDGRLGWPEHALFDRIIITAAPERFPRNLFSQLEDGGIAVAPVGAGDQRIMRYQKLGDEIKEESLIGVYFVPCVRGQ
jgi:protein-L-isoaspartate(D-aspartate) O-methyltransferase